MNKQSLCQTCYSHCGCSWHERFEPRRDWIATPTYVHDSQVSYDSYLVEDCPAYAPRKSGHEAERIKTTEIATVLGVNLRTVFRYLKRGVVNQKLAERGLPFRIVDIKDEIYNQYFKVVL